MRLPAVPWNSALNRTALAGGLPQHGSTHSSPPPRRAPPLDLVRSAVTARSALEASDLERLETLGDAFLKFAVSAPARRGQPAGQVRQAQVQATGALPGHGRVGAVRRMRHTRAQPPGRRRLLLTRGCCCPALPWPLRGSTRPFACLPGPPSLSRPQVSAQLFTCHRQYHEGQLTKRKELVVANVHLAEAAIKAGGLVCARAAHVAPCSADRWRLDAFCRLVF